MLLETCETNRNRRAISAVCDRAVEVIISSKVSHAAEHMTPSSNAAPPAALDEEWVRKGARTFFLPAKRAMKCQYDIGKRLLRPKITIQKSTFTL